MSPVLRRLMVGLFLGSLALGCGGSGTSSKPPSHQVPADGLKINDKGVKTAPAPQPDLLKVPD
jgi:hypothetical protein